MNEPQNRLPGEKPSLRGQLGAFIFVSSYFGSLEYDKLESSRQNTSEHIWKNKPLSVFFKIMLCYICIKLYLNERIVSDPVMSLCISLKSLAGPVEQFLKNGGG